MAAKADSAGINFGLIWTSRAPCRHPVYVRKATLCELARMEPVVSRAQVSPSKSLGTISRSDEHANEMNFI
jgi:hypothetical protein